MAKTNLVLSFLWLGIQLHSCKGYQLVPAIFMFGDSLIDVGNNNYLPLSLLKADFPHNGIDFPTKRPTGRFSNGKNSADFFAEKVGLPTSPPYLSPQIRSNPSTFLKGVSFASGGSGVFDSTDNIFGQAIPITRQVDYYVSVHQAILKQLQKHEVETYLSKSIYVLILGSNDFFDYFGKLNFLRRKSSGPAQLVDLMTIKLKGQIKRLYWLGSRKFVVSGIGKIGCVPEQRVKNPTQECNEEENFWAMQYNQRLKIMLNQLKMELHGFTFSYLDVYNFMNDILQNPVFYGFSETKSACCGVGKFNAVFPCVPISVHCVNRRDHLFWDLFHPTEAADMILSEFVFNGSSRYTYPYNVKELIAG